MSDNPIVEVGKFFLTKGTGDGRIWIGRSTGDRAGEGGDYSTEALEALLDKFYTERF